MLIQIPFIDHIEFLCCVCIRSDSFSLFFVFTLRFSSLICKARRTQDAGKLTQFFIVAWDGAGASGVPFPPQGVKSAVFLGVVLARWVLTSANSATDEETRSQRVLALKNVARTKQIFGYVEYRAEQVPQSRTR